MIKRIILPIILVLLFKVSVGQQMPLSYQNYFNYFSLQPAYTGYNDGLNLLMSSKSNMLKQADAPSTLELNATFATKGSHSFGVNLISDRIGLLRNDLLQVSYAQTLQVSDKGHLLAGFSGGIGENYFNFSGINAENTSDFNQVPVTNKPIYTLGYGLAFKGEKFTAGIGAPFGVRSLANYSQDETENLMFIDQMLVLNASYEFQLDSLITLNVGGILHDVDMTNSIFEGFFDLRYNEKLSFITGYLSTGIVPLIFNVDFNQSLSFYMGYEFNVVSANHIPNNGFELGIGYRFNKKNKCEESNKILTAENDSLLLAFENFKTQSEKQRRLDSIQKQNDELAKIELQKEIEKQTQKLKEINDSVKHKNEIIDSLSIYSPASRQELDENNVLVEKSHGYFVIVQSSVDKEMLQKDLKKWQKTESTTFIIKPEGSKWYNIAIFKHHTLEEALMELRKVRKKHKSAWVKQQ